MRVVDSEGNELKKVICQACKGTTYQERTEKKSPGVTHTSYFLCSECNGVGWVWEKVKKS